MRVTTLVVAIATTFALVSAAPAPFPVCCLSHHVRFRRDILIQPLQPGGPQEPGNPHYHNYPDWKRGVPGEPGWKRGADQPGWKRGVPGEPGWKRGDNQPGWKRGVPGEPGWKREPAPEPQPTGASTGHASTNGIPGASPGWKREPQTPGAAHAAPAGIPGSSPGW
jgi:hypothetical protein